MEHTFSEHYLREKSAHGNFVLALIAGFAVALIGAIIWIGIAMITGWHPGFMALVIAVTVGLSVRLSGRGSHFIFGLIGVVFTFLSCLAGEIGVTLQLATTPLYDLYGVLMHVDLIAMSYSVVTHASTVMMVVYGISAYVAYVLSIFARK
jgi:hypothetical protein